MIVGIVLVATFDLEAKGVAVVGDSPRSPRTSDCRTCGLGDLDYLLTGAVGVVFLAVGESLGAARAFASRHR